MPINSKYRKDLIMNKNNLICIDGEESHMYNTYHSEEARVIQIRFNRCMNDGDSKNPTCASPEEITEYFKNLYVGVLMNRIRFDPNYYGVDAIE